MTAPAPHTQRTSPTLVGRVRRGLSVALAIAGLFFHAALPVVHQPRAMALSSLDAAVAICTATGLQVVRLSDLAAMGGDGGSPEDKTVFYDCPICLGSKLAGIGVLPDSVALSSPTMMAAISFPARRDNAVLASASSERQPRAPPTIA